MVSDDQLIGKESYVTLIDETTQSYPLTVIDVDCPFFTGNTEALCMEDTLYDLVIGNIDGSKLPDMSHFSAAAVIDLRLSKAKMLVRNLRFLIRLLMKIRRLSDFYLKQAQATDPNLDTIRERVESGNITVSRGLDSSETKFVRKKGFIYMDPILIYISL